MPGRDLAPSRAARGLLERSGRQLDRARLRWIREKAGAGAGDCLLDLGCGQPTFLRLAAGELGSTGVGLDVSDAGWRERAWAGVRLLKGTVRGALGLTAPWIPTSFGGWAARSAGDGHWTARSSGPSRGSCWGRRRGCLSVYSSGGFPWGSRWRRRRRQEAARRHQILDGQPQ